MSLYRRAFPEFTVTVTCDYELNKKFFVAFQPSIFARAKIIKFLPHIVDSCLVASLVGGVDF